MTPAYSILCIVVARWKPRVRDPELRWEACFNRKLSMDIDELILQLRSDDAQASAAAFDELHRHIDVSKDHIYAAAKVEEDSRLKGAMVELLGDSRDPKFLPFIAMQLRSDDIEVQFWAYAALGRMGTAQALSIRDKYHFHDLVRQLRLQKCGT